MMMKVFNVSSDIIDLVLEIISKMEKVLFSKKSLCKMYHKKSF